MEKSFGERVHTTDKISRLRSLAFASLEMTVNRSASLEMTMNGRIPFLVISPELKSSLVIRLRYAPVSCHFDRSMSRSLSFRPRRSRVEKSFGERVHTTDKISRLRSLAFASLEMTVNRSASLEMTMNGRIPFLVISPELKSSLVIRLRYAPVSCHFDRSMSRSLSFRPRRSRVEKSFGERVHTTDKISRLRSLVFASLEMTLNGLTSPSGLSAL